jgi:hypothetical protein
MGPRTQLSFRARAETRRSVTITVVYCSAPVVFPRHGVRGQSQRRRKGGRHGAAASQRGFRDSCPEATDDGFHICSSCPSIRQSVAEKLVL